MKQRAPSFLNLWKILLEKFKILFFIILFHLSFSQAYAKSKWTLSLQESYFFDSSNESKTKNQHQAHINFIYKKKFEKTWALVTDLNLDYYNIEHSLDSSFLFRAHDSGVFKKYNKFIFSAGLLSHDIGVSQAFSPLNFVDTFSYIDPIDPKKISSPTLRLQYKNKNLRLLASYLPYRFENIYPGSKSPWLPRTGPDSIVSEKETYLLPSAPLFYFTDPQELDGALKNNFFATLQFKNSKIFSQLIYFNGLDSDPTFDLNLKLDLLDADPNNTVLQINNPISISPQNQKIERLGFSLRYTLPIKWRLLYEGSYAKGNPNNRQGFRESHFHTLGLEWGLPFGDYLLLGVLQAYRSKTSNKSSLGLVSPFKEAYLLGIKMDFKSLSFNSGYLYSRSLEANLFKFNLSYSYKKIWSLALDLIILSGKENEFISSILSKDHGSLKFSYFW